MRLTSSCRTELVPSSRAAAFWLSLTPTCASISDAVAGPQ